MQQEKIWHLVENEKEAEVTELELNLWRAFYSFERWQENCEQVTNGTDLSGVELSILHIIRMKNRPKTINDIGRLLNREDQVNMRYSIKKLLHMGLIEKIKTPSNKQIAYCITPKGNENTDRYVKARKTILLELFNSQPNIKLAELSKGFLELKTLYDEASKQVASFG